MYKKNLDTSGSIKNIIHKMHKQITHIYIYIYIYVCVCVCVCLYIYRQRESGGGDLALNNLQ